jgi:hypothetical protein
VQSHRLKKPRRKRAVLQGQLKTCSGRSSLARSRIQLGQENRTERKLPCPRCRFRFQCETRGVREINVLREASPAAFSVSIETTAAFLPDWLIA